MSKAPKPKRSPEERRARRELKLEFLIGKMERASDRLHRAGKPKKNAYGKTIKVPDAVLDKARRRLHTLKERLAALKWMNAKWESDLSHCEKMINDCVRVGDQFGVQRESNWLKGWLQETEADAAWLRDLRKDRALDQ